MHYSLTRATTWNIAGYIYLLVASFISTPILVQHLGISQFSTYSLILASTIFVSAINLGLPQAVVRALAIDHKFSPRRQTIWATSSLLFILTGILAGIIAVGLVYPLHLDLSLLSIIFGIGLVNNLVSHYLTLPQAEGHFGYFNTKTFIIGTGNTLLAAFLAWRGQGILAILSAQLLCYLITLLPLAYFSLKYFPRPRDGKVSLSEVKSLTTFGLKNWGGKLIGQVQSQYAKYLLASLSPITLSAYVIAQGLVQKLAGGVVQLATAIYPASARVGLDESFRRLYHKLQFGLLALGLLGVGVYYLLGLPFLLWWLHDSQLVALVDSIMRVLVWYFVLLLLTPLPSTILDGVGRPGLGSLFAFITTFIEIALALILFPRYGLFAPVYSALIAVVLTTPPLLIVTNRIMIKSSL
ncbi:MAG: MATE family efflux transporter [Microgenomates group bacterium]